MTAPPEITQRDLRTRSKEIMDAVESGSTFTVTRGGHEIGTLIPVRRRRRFVSREEFATVSRGSAGFDLGTFRADQAIAHDDEIADRHEF